MRKQQNETAQGSLFVQECLMTFDQYSEMRPHLYGPAKTDKRLENAVMESRSLTRLNDPKTSKDAAEKTKEFRTRHIAKIWNCLKDNGPLTYKEIAFKISMEPVAVARRRKEMEGKQLIEVWGDVKDGCQLWRAL